MMKETEMKRVPKLRFPEFTDDWEQRKLDELSEFITKGATPTTYGFEWQTSGIPFFRNDAIKNNRFIYGDYSYISKEANEVLKRSEIHASDILIAITGDIGKVGIIPENIEKGNINQHIARVRVTKDAIPYFIYQSLCIERQQRKYQLIKTGLSMPQLSLEQIRETVVLCPSLSEQEKIGEYFCHIDNLITLHQRKLEKLKKLRKGMMQKLFSQEIRFKADDGSGFPEWEEKKVGSLGDIVGGGTPSTKKKEYWCGKIAWVSSADIGDNDIRNINITRFITREAIADSATKIIPKDSILIVSRVGVGKVAKASCNLCTSQDFTNIVNLDGDVTFLSYAVLRLMQSKLQCVQGTSIKGIPNDEIKNYTLNIPCLAEQQKIANCLSSLDGVIEKQKATLAAWEELKKGLLQQMFV